jgi:hypothetical protein
MGKLKGMGIGLKAGFGRALSRADLYSYCDDFIRRPPMRLLVWRYMRLLVWR